MESPDFRQYHQSETHTADGRRAILWEPRRSRSETIAARREAVNLLAAVNGNKHTKNPEDFSLICKKSH